MLYVCIYIFIISIYIYIYKSVLILDMYIQVSITAPWEIWKRFRQVDDESLDGSSWNCKVSGMKEIYLGDWILLTEFPPPLTFFLGGIVDTLWTWQLTFCRGGVQGSKFVYSNLFDVFLRLFMVISECHWVFGMFLEHHQFLCHQTVPWMFATKTCFSCHVSCQSIFKSFCHSTKLVSIFPNYHLAMA